MKFFQKLLFSLLLLASVLPAIEIHAQGKQVYKPDTIRESGINLEIRSAFTEIPAHGYYPLQVTIENHSNKNHTWNLTTTSSISYNDGRTIKQTSELTVSAGETKVFDLLTPVTRLSDSGWSQQLHLSVSGFGIPVGASRTQYSHLSNRYSPSLVAMSESLSARNWSELQNPTSSRYRPAEGSPFHLGMIPNDWRVFSGFSFVWITDNDWRTTDAATRLTLLDWVATGGILTIAREEHDKTDLHGLKNLSFNQPIAHGLGEIRAHPRNGDLLDTESVLGAIDSSNSKYSESNFLENEYAHNRSPLLATVEKIKIRTGLTLSFLLLFGILIGPVNLFIFAPRSKRYRLFWTTPALSLGASLLMFFLILFQDGTGGSGNRIALWNYLPDENKTVFLQEQVSRTALLTNRRFSTEIPVFLSQINTKLVPSLDSSSSEVRQKAYSGDWFRNRSVQAHFLKGVTSTRSRIEVTSTPNEPPKLLSTFPFTLESVFYIDNDQNWWLVENLQSGESRTAAETKREVFTSARGNFLQTAGAIIEMESRRLPTNPGTFFAFASDPEGNLNTLSSIKWRSNQSLHTGPAVLSR